MHRLTRSLKPPYLQLLHLNPPLSIVAFLHASRGRPMDPPSPTAITGVDDFVHVVEGDHNPKSGSSSSEGNNRHDYYERKVLPPELSHSAVVLTCESTAEGGVCDVYMVGTAHVSTESSQEVHDLIDFLKPQVVFLELCSNRVHVLTPTEFEGVPTMREIKEMWKKNQDHFGILYNWFLAKACPYPVLVFVTPKLAIMHGADFRMAYEVAMKYGGKVILGDRPVHITLRRTWAKMPLWHKMKLIYTLLFPASFVPSPRHLITMLKELNDVDLFTLVIQETNKKFPILMQTFVHERDQYMSATLLKVASEHNSVVAVVGKGHLQGIQKNWKQPIEVKELLSIPTESTIPVGKIIKTFGAAVVGIAILSGLYISSKK
ncbi:hypothetical protein ACJIZ3_010839 [Penstemon smallii]|uniref:TraB family protein n=1 Tax=Penstemon smallii TaxID=265156 RepID=A0ABD3UHJ6_9LAMI